MKRLNISGHGFTTLVGVEIPEGVKELWCNNNLLTSLEGCPSSVEILYCSNNRLTTLQGCPASIIELWCDNNLLTSLDGCSSSVRNLYCYNNRLTTLEGCPKGLEELDCINNRLRSLYGCPESITALYCLSNPINEEYQNKSLWEIHVINRVKDYKRGIGRLTVVFVVRIQRWWRRKWYDEVDEEGISRFCKMCTRCDQTV